MAHCYPEEMKEFPQTVRDVLQRHSSNLDRTMRMVILKLYLGVLVHLIKYWPNKIFVPHFQGGGGHFALVCPSI